MSKPQRTPSLEFTHATEDMAAVRVGLSVSFPDIRPPDRKYAHSGTQTLWDVESPHEEGVRPDGRSKLPETPSPTSSVVEKTATMVSFCYIYGQNRPTSVYYSFPEYLHGEI